MKGYPISGFSGMVRINTKYSNEHGAIVQRLGMLSAHMEQGCSFSRIWILPVFQGFWTLRPNFSRDRISLDSDIQISGPLDRSGFMGSGFRFSDYWIFTGSIN
jgi:hypothetical protein